MSANNTLSICSKLFCSFVLRFECAPVACCNASQLNIFAQLLAILRLFRASLKFVGSTQWRTFYTHTCTCAFVQRFFVDAYFLGKLLSFWLCFSDCLLSQCSYRHSNCQRFLFVCLLLLVVLLQNRTAFDKHAQTCSCNCKIHFKFHN